LNLRGEWVFEIQGLPVPPSDQAARAEDFSAVALFLQSARRAQASFELRAEAWRSVVRICQMVEGMPLGIELAAAWVPALSCHEIAQEIERNLDFLSASVRDVPERHRSLRAVFDHSWHLLSAQEQQVLRQLSVFWGGFDREAAEQVAGATLSLLSALVAKSLVRRSTARHYALHELLRQYAAAQLEADPEAGAVRQRHVDYYLDFLQQREAALKSDRQKDGLAELTAEVHNIRQAWAWASDHGQIAHLRNASFALLYFHEVRGRYHEGERAFRRAADMLRRFREAASADEVALQVALCDMLTNQAYFCLRRGKSAEAQATLRQCIEQLRALGDQAVLRWALRYYGLACQLNGRFEEAEACLRESLDLSQAAGQLWDVSISCGYLGMVAHRRGALDDAGRFLGEGLALSRRLGDAYITSYHLINLAQVLVAQGRNAEAREAAQESLSLTKDVHDCYGIGTALYCLGLVAQSEGNALEAHAAFEQSLALFQELGDPLNASRVYVRLGYLMLASGDVRAAQGLFSAAAGIAEEAHIWVLDALTGLALLHAQMGQGTAALELVIHVLQHPSPRTDTKRRAQLLQSELEAQLAPEQIETVRALAQQKTFEAIRDEVRKQADVQAPRSPYLYRASRTPCQS
jgi:tetratricopeptide (TPR) repeat protein